MNVQCAVVVVHPTLQMESTSLDLVEVIFFFIQTFFVMDKERTMRTPNARSTRESPKGVIVWNTPQPARQGRYFC